MVKRERTVKFSALQVRLAPTSPLPVLLTDSIGGGRALAQSVKPAVSALSSTPGYSLRPMLEGCQTTLPLLTLEAYT